MRGGPVLLLSIGLWLAGCGSSDEEKERPKYPRDDVFRVNHIQAKGTHNSYHIAAPGQKSALLNYTEAPLDVQLEDQGVRQVELDAHWDETQQTLFVYHEFFDKLTTCDTLVACLSTMKTWSDDHPGHHILFVQIEPKDLTLPADIEAYFKHFDDAILEVWPRNRILTPDDVRGDAATLREAIVNNGWPTLGATRQKILFFIDNSKDFRDKYTRGGTSLDGRLMFVDSEPGVPYEATYVLNDPAQEQDGPAIASALAQGFLVRTRADSDNVEPFAGDTSRQQIALASGAQMVSTDYPAHVEGVDYVLEIPGGTPSRCSPVTAPSDCTASDIEDPERLR